LHRYCTGHGSGTRSMATTYAALNPLYISSLVPQDDSCAQHQWTGCWRGHRPRRKQAHAASTMINVEKVVTRGGDRDKDRAHMRGVQLAEERGWRGRPRPRPRHLFMGDKDTCPP
ncbi:hypothetical protein BHM03_00007548, partial [Ensete ventricosum]